MMETQRLTALRPRTRKDKKDRRMAMIPVRRSARHESLRSQPSSRMRSTSTASTSNSFGPEK